MESEKNKFLADSAFVLRKHEVFLKVKEEVTKAEQSYNRILGYAKDSEDGNSDYWKNQLPFYQKTIDLAKVDVQKTMENLAEKGVNVAEIEKQTRLTSENIASIEAQIEELPIAKNALIIKYREEKEVQLEMNLNKDYSKDREIENKKLFRTENFSNVYSTIENEKIEENRYTNVQLGNNRYTSRR